MTRELQPGMMLGAFEIIREIDHGGMGTVYEARNSLTNVTRAIKVIRPEFARDPEFMRRFLREVRIASKVEHPNLVKVLEPSRQGAVVFLPMELLEGKTLKKQLDGGRFGLIEALATILPVCRAVAAVHAHHIIHRDLKPANIFLSKMEDGSIVPKVLDFGLARDLAAENEATSAGVIPGTVPYMSFEHASGQTDLDGRTDLYALGVITYQMLTGYRPYEDDANGSAYSKRIHGLPFPRPRDLVPEIPSGVDQAIMIALAHRREQRFASVDLFIRALEESMVGETVDAFVSSTPAPPTHPLDTGLPGSAIGVAPGQASPGGGSPMEEPPLPNSQPPTPPSASSGRRIGLAQRAGLRRFVWTVPLVLVTLAFLEVWSHGSPRSSGVPSRSAVVPVDVPRVVPSVANSGLPPEVAVSQFLRPRDSLNTSIPPAPIRDGLSEAGLATDASIPPVRVHRRTSIRQRRPCVPRALVPCLGGP